jgi:hypothetical protein
MKKLLLILSLNFYLLPTVSQNNYLDFDGVNDYVDVPNSGVLISGANALSMTCKVYPKNVAPTWPDYDGILGFRNDTNCDFYLIQLTASQVEGRFRNANGTAYTLTYNGLVLNQWNHFFLIYNGTTLKLYSGETEVASVSASGSMPVSPTNTFQIGVMKYGTTLFYNKGYIDEVSLWNKALNTGNISSIIANSGEIVNALSETQLKVYYKFNQGIAYGSNTGLTTLIDEKTTQNGTLINFGLIGTSSNWGSQSLNISDFSTKPTLSVYPNPAENFLTISCQNTIENIKILDSTGRLILEQASPKDIVSIAHLNSGSYLLVVNNTEVTRFIKK